MAVSFSLTGSGGGTAPAIWEYDPTVNAATCAMTPTSCFTKVFSSGPPPSDPNGPQQLTDPIFLPLPNGQVLVADPTNDTHYHLYTPSGAPQASWRPTLTSISGPSAGVYTLTGTQLNGLTNGSSFGDDRNSASYYPIVGLRSSGGQVYYARSYAFNQMAPLPGATGSCKFVLPPGIPNGSYSVFVSASGISSSNVLALNVTQSHVTGISGPTNVAPGSNGTMTVQLSVAAPSGGTQVTLASDNTSVASVPASVTVAQGHVSATFTLSSHSYGFARISASVASATQFQPAVLKFGWNVNALYDNQLFCSNSGFFCGANRRNDPTMPTGANQDQWTVNISNAAPSSGVVVTLQGGDPRWASVPASVTIPSGQRSATFAVSRGSQSFGALTNITATIGAGSRTNSISTINSADFPQIAAPRSMLSM